MNLSKSLITAYKWNVVGNIAIRSLSVVSTLVLVRVLSPEDFGIMAMATIFIGFFQMLSNASVNRYLILLERPSKEDYDAAWTLTIILRFISMSILFALSSTIAKYMTTPELTLVLQIICFVYFLAAFMSPGMIKLERDINFKALNKIAVIAKLSATIITVYFAIKLESYFALIIGESVLISATLILSYVICTHKPALNFSFDPKMFQFASYIFLRNLVGYSRSKVDAFIVGKLFGNDVLGGFTVARQFAIMPQDEIFGPAMQPAYAALSQLKNNIAQFDAKLYQALFIGYSLLIPSAFGLLYCAENFVAVVLGAQWIAVAEYIGLIAFLMLPFYTQPILNIAYDSRQKSKYSIVPDILALTFMILAIYYFIPQSIVTFVDLRLVVGLLTLLILFIAAKLFLGLQLRLLLITLAPAALCSIVMFAFLNLMTIDTSVQTIDLIIEISLGFASYSLCYYLMFAVLIKLWPGSFVTRLIPNALYNLLPNNKQR
ncbi:oligosaccharide flippase family protein [Glaciecola sp. MF2-115]|uniref:oligosaccharide flippase family protein n=1 Tax=Glaciecola sp. MF2-115 TaxID=3384827 RepID=UPI0039A36E86